MNGACSSVPQVGFSTDWNAWDQIPEMNKLCSIKPLKYNYEIPHLWKILGIFVWKT